MNRHPHYENARIKEKGNGNASTGEVKLSLTKTIWFITMCLVATIGGAMTASLETVLLFLTFTGFTLCFGHSLGMHRYLIHQSFQCSKWLGYFLVHLGVITGLGGPFAMIKTHDMRDWAQRQRHCHDYFGHRQSFFKDGYWQLLCDIHLKQPPQIIIEENYKNDPVLSFMERYWKWQQLPWAMILFALGGVAWVIWGICARVAISITGHWLIGYFAHNQGGRSWHINGAFVQGYNVPFAALITMGESWHNNHHAFPGSAKLGLEKGQLDPGSWMLMLMQKAGWVWDIKLPQHLAPRQELTARSNA
ncbi:acyl-CoA desaturase [Thalassotalea sp. PS06]|uniref:acyl-CoA desaturase n=1 Tax=Thalassotalea sp. PS06 TaxID=2594005 RepID=UPI0011656F5F|nr:acyl-CoA desaturase [Thalassotalea sp. PS06]QDP02667.1 acyl-CoA desaturase [Thalassotalea sp. PS06]